MKTIFLFIGMVMLSFSAMGQSASNEKSTSQKVAVEFTLSQKYAPKLLEDYQENAKNKIEDLFSYFQMLTDASLTDDLKKEIVKNIKNCFQNQNPDVIDFTSSTKDKIPLNSLIDKLLFSEPILFKVTYGLQNDSETALSWKMNYSVTRTKSGESQNIKINQLVYLFEQSKAFGNSNKNVTITFLGKME